MQIFLAIFLVIVVALLIAGTIFISLPSKVLTDIEKSVVRRKDGEKSDDEVAEKPE